MLKFLHAADLHLDSPFASLSPEKAAERRTMQRNLLRSVIDLCNREQCQLLLLAGDLFDSADIYRETTEMLLQLLSECSAQVLIAPGNHDRFSPDSPYATETWPENVHIFSGNTISSVSFPEWNCTVYGAAFTAPNAPSLLRGFRAEDPAQLRLMVLHGDALNADSPYNPVTAEQIAASGLTYLALGHIHQASGLRYAGATAYAWPGCPAGRGFDETGPKGVYIGSVTEERCELTFHALDGLRYEILHCSAPFATPDELRQKLPADTENLVCRLILDGESEPVDSAQLLEDLTPEFAGLQIIDRTVRSRSLWEDSGEDSLRGLFLSTLKSRLEESTEPEAARIRQAARLGLALMDKREVPQWSFES